MPRSSGQQYSKCGNTYALQREIFTSEGTKHLILFNVANLKLFLSMIATWGLKGQTLIQCNAKNLLF